ncbi:MAG TPA: helix-turn-helix domain-containing protein [Candidatus Bathyarchaeota archaeon]|nr:helix-turn-helix domain-containing protein [Candidatus Bathyarchaeota archaeon]
MGDCRKNIRGEKEVSEPLENHLREIVFRKIAGDIVASRDTGDTLRKWRIYFNLTQRELAERIGVTPSIISDYEAGRRVPGLRFLRRFIRGMLEADMAEGGVKIHRLVAERTPPDVILAIHEYNVPVSIREVADAVNGEVTAYSDGLERNIYGFTVVDSLKAILYFRGNEFLAIYGETNERVIVFTDVERGRSPFIAIRVAPLKPRAVVLQGCLKLDSLAAKIAESEEIVAITTMLDRKTIINNLYELGK